jgi:hypothetical protein
VQPRCNLATKKGLKSGQDGGAKIDPETSAMSFICSLLSKGIGGRTRPLLVRPDRWAGQDRIGPLVPVRQIFLTRANLGVTCCAFVARLDAPTGVKSALASNPVERQEPQLPTT